MNVSIYGKNNYFLRTSFENLNLIFLIFTRKKNEKSRGEGVGADSKIIFEKKKVAEGDAYSAYSGPKSSSFYDKIMT